MLDGSERGSNTHFPRPGLDPREVAGFFREALRLPCRSMDTAGALRPTAAYRPRINPWLIAPIVALAAFMEVLDISIANVSLPHIAGNLGASQDESAWVLTSYLVTNAISMPVSGWISTTIGRKRFFLICIIGFTIASLLCGIAPSLAALVFFRALQGAAGGGLQPTAQAILTDTFPPKQREMAFAVYGISVVFAPALGPTLGGWITDNISWRWVFLLNVPVGAILVFLILAFIDDPPHLVSARLDARRRGVRFDVLGFGFVALGLGALQVVLDRGQEDDWLASPLIATLAAISALALIALVIRELLAREPIVDLRLLANRTFAVSSLLMFMLGFVLLGSTFLVPAFVQELLGYTATDAGLVITTGALMLVALMPFVGRAIGRVDARVLIAFGLTVCGLALLWVSHFDLATDYFTVMLARVMQALGLAFLFIPINTEAFGSVSPAKVNNASALINVCRNLGGSVGISIASTLLVRRSQFHHSVLVTNLHAGNPAYRSMLEHLTSRFAPIYGSPNAAEHALATIGFFVDRQSRLLAYLDAFWFFGWVFLAMVPIVFLMKAAKGHGAPPAH